MATTPTPNIDKLEAVLHAIGGNPNVSYQLRDEGRAGGFFTVTYYPSPTTRCAIGQGDTLADALEEARRDAQALLAKVTVADLEKVAA